MNTILVMGASRGIGLELVRQYTEDGRRVIATVRDDAGRERVHALGADVLTVDLAVPDSDTLTAVQDLHEQAATLLQVPQLGILVLTLMRAGRRQGLYYVSDEQLAKQTLAPLLLRDEAASLELKVAYDPAWSGYFEYAGYLSA